MRFSIPSLVTLVVVARAVTAQSTKPKLSINPPRSVVRGVDFASLPPDVESATNAERFAQGLPPMRPRGRNHHRTGSRRNTGNRVASAPRAETSPSVPVQKNCNLLAKTSDGNIGYLSRQLNIFGQYGTFQSGQTGALEVQFSYSVDSPTPFDLIPTNGVTQAFPYVGGVISAPSDEPGANDFGVGSSHYAYIAATKRTPPGSPLVAGDNSYATATGTPSSYESAIWHYDPATNVLTPQWTNSDGSTPVTQLLYANDGSDVLIITGSADTLNREFETNYPVITFTCVSP